MNEKASVPGGRSPKEHKMDYANDGPHQFFDPPGVAEALSRMPAPAPRTAPKPRQTPSAFYPEPFDVV